MYIYICIYMYNCMFVDSNSLTRVGSREKVWRGSAYIKPTGIFSVSIFSKTGFKSAFKFQKFNIQELPSVQFWGCIAISSASIK